MWSKKKFRVLFTVLLLLLIFLNFKRISRVAYPIEYEKYILEYSYQYNVDPYLVASVINTESHFNSTALSSKGAYGLMQIMPDTAQWISEHVELNNTFTFDMLYDPEININMGCWYIDNLSKEFNGDISLVLAAYNGGRGNVNKWLSNRSYSKDGKTLYDIPFKETKNYLKKVKFNYKVYKLLYDL